MFKKIAQNKSILEHYISLAKKEAKSNSPMEVFEAFVKIAQGSLGTMSATVQDIKTQHKEPNEALKAVEAYLHDNYLAIAAHVPAKAYEEIIAHPQKWAAQAAKHIVSGNMSLEDSLRNVNIGVADKVSPPKQKPTEKAPVTTIEPQQEQSKPLKKVTVKEFLKSTDLENVPINEEDIAIYPTGTSLQKIDADIVDLRQKYKPRKPGDSPAVAIATIKELLLRNKGVIIDAAMKDPGIQTNFEDTVFRAMEFISEQSARWATYSATDMVLNNLHLKSSLLKLIKQGTTFEYQADQDSGVSLEDLKTKGWEASVPATQGEANDGDKYSTTEEIVEMLKEHFTRIMEDPNQIILSYYVEQVLQPALSRLEAAWENAAPEDKAQAEAELDLFTKKAIDFIQVRYQKAQGENNKTLMDVQNAVSETLGNVNLDALTEKIMSSNLFSVPKAIRKYATDYPEFATALLKGVITASAIIHAKQGMRVSFPNIDPRVQGGHHKVSEAAILHYIVMREIKRMPEEKQQDAIHLLHEAVDVALSKEGTVVGFGNPGTLKNKLHNYATPMLYSGLIKQVIDEMGDKFLVLTEEQKQHIVDLIFARVHPVMPHATFADPYKFNVSESNEVQEQEIKQNILDRLESAAEVVAKKRKPGTFYHPFLRQSQSALKGLIKKYASHSIYRH